MARIEINRLHTIRTLISPVKEIYAFFTKSFGFFRWLLKKDLSQGKKMAVNKIQRLDDLLRTNQPIQKAGINRGLHIHIDLYLLFWPDKGLGRPSQLTLF